MNCNEEIIINQNTIQNSVFVNQLSSSQSININAGGGGGGGGGGSVFSVNGQIGVVLITPTSLGLGQVNNTSDLNKPLSYAAISALLLKTDISAFNTLNNIVTSNYNSWNNVYLTVNSLSSNWYNSSISSNVSGNWQVTYLTVNALSSNWNNISFFESQSANNLSVYNTFNAQSANNASVYSYVNRTSSLIRNSYLPLSGGLMQGIITTNSLISSNNDITTNNLNVTNELNYFSSGVLKVYQVYNPQTNSLDTIFN